MDINLLAVQGLGYIGLALAVILILRWEWDLSEKDRKQRKADAMQRDLERFTKVRW